ncbi:MAG: response regulator transcription factor [Bacteroidetes bacterium]|jgi:DNA-binding LytR/AlgR family response regulator|nr:response regulator transcription factor [Bacteroidota bacterium]MBX7238976.1 LytTR family DNA-binding domain-containing protein [Bacteroidia bacterium]MCC7513180.1 response regulator transcription factor [Bacteroidia bacterium]MCW5919303.1 response regulator transcription factor [Bacteroidota bacterium]HCI58608.1 DNA-binding response regulator [Bacteroidota bacterium]
MKIVIFEDEEPAARRLIKLLNEVSTDVEIVSVIDSVRSGKEFMKQNKSFDLIISDIRLADGLSFEIFKSHTVKLPVIFSTAYDEYAIEAFRNNGIDYLLKPVKREELKTAIQKYENWFSDSTSGVNYDVLLQTLLQEKKGFQKRIVIRFADTIKTVEIEEAAYFFTENKISNLCTFNGESFIIDYNLDELELILDPAVFFRINRQFIVNFKAIQKMNVVSKSRVKLTLHPSTTQDTIVSTERSGVFKQWLAGK